MDGATKVVGNRVAAFLIDIIMLSIVYGIFFALLAKQTNLPVDFTGSNSHFTVGDTTYFVTGSDQTLLTVIWLVSWILYTWVLPGKTGWTVGKLICQIRVVNAEGQVAGVGRNALREILWIVDYFPYIIPALTGFIVALTSKNNQRVGDMVANTYVVKKEAFGMPILNVATAAPAVPAYPASPPTQGTPTQAAPPSTTTPVSPGTPTTPSVPGAATPAQPPTQAAPAQPQATQPNPPANWYPDPKGERRLRYWDGSKWTEHTAD